MSRLDTGARAFAAAALAAAADPAKASGMQAYMKCLTVTPSSPDYLRRPRRQFGQVILPFLIRETSPTSPSTAEVGPSRPTKHQAHSPETPVRAL